MFGEDFISMLTVEGAAAFGLNHPLVLVILSISFFHQLPFELLAKMLKIGCNLWLLFVFIMSLTMVLSSFEKEGNKVGIRVAGIALVFYLLHYLSSLWDAIQFTKPFNIFTYYQPEDLMTGQRSFLLHFMVLSSLILLCLLISIYQFNRRDIPG
jgi:ABC-type transport system involved in multi-copper enzyme maturation permease subunit